MTGLNPLDQVRRRWRREHRAYRVLEMLPGLLVWVTLATILFLSFVQPLWAMLFIVVFDFYWLVRVVYILVYLVIAYRRFRRTQTVDWAARVRRVPGWDRIYHAVFIPTSTEPLALLESTLEALERVDFPRERVVVVLAFEDRFRAQAEPKAAALTKRYGHRFRHLLVTFHPANIPGELAGKGSNIAWAGRRFQAWVDTEDIPYEDILVSSFDADTQIHPAYFSYLTYIFLKHPNRLRTSYQPVPLFHNNIWQSPALMRVIANSTTFWLMSETLRPDRLFTFSSHSMPFRALVDVDFWQSDIVTEDSRIFLQGLLRYDGDYTVTPLYLPLSMDTVLSGSLKRSLINQYKQQRRWAYGVENFPYMVWNFARNRRISFGTKLKYIWNQVEGVYSWATAPIIIFVLSWLPQRVASAELQATTIAQTSPYLVAWLTRAAMIGLLLSAVLSTILLPPRPKGVHRAVFIPMFLQWLLFPLCMIVFGAIPATDAQTRLMLGKYLGFWVTEKVRNA